MKKQLLSLVLAATAMYAAAEQVTLNGKNYEVDRLVDQEIGPGTRHMRFRIPSYPLNINVIQVDLTNPYNRVETTTANENSRGTELLTTAAKRQSRAGHRAIAGANANFWVVPSQKEDPVYDKIARGASVRNGQIVVESNQHRDQWDGGTMRTGTVAMSYDKKMYVDYCTSSIKVSNDKIGSMEVHQVNKGIHDDELSMYNSFYGKNTAFLPITDGKLYSEAPGGDATEVLLDFVEGQSWTSGQDITFTVAEVRLNAGKGKLGNHDMALVGRGANRDAIARLAEGDVVTLRYTWTYNPGSAEEVTPLVEQAIGPNALVMRGGVLTEHNTNEAYNSQVYSRTGYGCSADGKTLYIIVIDKSVDLTYGASAGTSTTVMCEFARYLGCSNMANFDAGGSAEMFVNGRIENTTTEPNPRSVNNGWLVYCEAPEDAADSKTVARLEFADCYLESPMFATSQPKVIAYNRYGAVLTYDLEGVTLSCDQALGTCDGASFTAGGQNITMPLTATYGNVSVSRDMHVVGSDLSIRIKPITIDTYRQYPIEVVSVIGNTAYNYDPATITWTVDDTSVAEIDANGILKGLASGSTTIHSTIGQFSDETTVNVEPATAATVDYIYWDEAKTKAGSGISSVAIADNGTISYTYGAPRDPYIQVSKDITFYSLPDDFTLEFTSSVAIKNITLDMRTPLHTSANVVTISPAAGDAFEAGVRHRVNIPMDQIGDVKDLAIYPILSKYVRFNILANTANKGAQTIETSPLVAHYSAYEAGIDAVPAADGAIVITSNPAESGAMVSVKGEGLAAVEVYNMAGVMVRRADAAAGIATFDAPAAGTYAVKAIGTGIQASAKLIVK